MGNYITELRLSSENNALFNEKDKYIVPLYQRAYSWKEKEIEQLIDDINDSNNDYYLGSLIVHSKGGKYEVIDGQQRLTTLFILFEALKLDNFKCLSFECRDNSNHTLEHLNKADLDDSFAEMNIINGFKIIKQKLAKEINEADFVDKLNKIIIYRIEVPENTDLNRYFEIMNTRGEQLEQHDILKGQLLSYLEPASEREAFATIWDACSDMTGYVQMHFERKVRDKLFGTKWDQLNEDIFDTLKIVNTDAKDEKIKVRDILKPSFKFDFSDGVDDKDVRVRFESIIEFNYFLQHTLKIYVNKNSIKHRESSDTNLVSDLLDDKKLLVNFKNVIDNGNIDGTPIKKNEFSIGFIKCLIKTRFLFDKYILKREYPLNDKEGIWSIKQLSNSGQQSQKKPFYINTKFHTKKEKEKTLERRTENNIMIQSCMRVSYTSPKIMHWITYLLDYLYDKKSEYEMVNLNEYAEKYVKNSLVDYIKNTDKPYLQGVNTPHIMLNYLDYLLWKTREKQFNDFVFEFRNSIEHWYPQHPSDGTFERWIDGVDRFGNLCLIQRNVNSKFSNMAPEAKKSTYKNMIAKGSLKLRIMASMTDSSLDWKNIYCDNHEKEMIELLETDLGL